MAATAAAATATAAAASHSRTFRATSSAHRRCTRRPCSRASLASPARLNTGGGNGAAVTAAAPAASVTSAAGYTVAGSARVMRRAFNSPTFRSVPRPSTGSAHRYLRRPGGKREGAGAQGAASVTGGRTAACPCTPRARPPPATSACTSPSPRARFPPQPMRCLPPPAHRRPCWRRQRALGLRRSAPAGCARRRAGRWAWRPRSVATGG